MHNATPGGEPPAPHVWGTSPCWRDVLEAQGRGTMAAGREDGRAELQVSMERKSKAVLYTSLLAPSPYWPHKAPQLLLCNEAALEGLLYPVQGLKTPPGPRRKAWGASALSNATTHTKGSQLPGATSEPGWESALMGKGQRG